jgi:hypothetical protein
MIQSFAFWGGVIVAVSALIALWAMMRHLKENAREILPTPLLWSGRSYPCPQCNAQMQAGWVMLGKGAIWSSREQGPPGAFAHIGSALPNTISLSLRPAANMAWRCSRCELLLIDHGKLVKPAPRRRGHNSSLE